MLKFLTSGESHGPGYVVILEGLPAGLPLTAAIINRDLARRQRGYGAGPRMKLERDRAHILGGVLEGRTTGAPLGLWIANHNHRQWQGKAIAPMTVPRPGHADLTASLKYAYPDLRPALERASARETVARVAVGAVCRHLLAQFGIRIGGYVRAIGQAEAPPDDLSLEARAQNAENNDVRAPNPAAAEAFRQEIQAAIQARDTVGGVVEVFASAVPAGLGSHVHWERRLDARLAAAMLSIPSAKGVEIGEAFANARRRGTQAHDPIHIAPDGTLHRPTNRAGGLEGGITNGQPVVVRVAFKPIATTLTPQPSADLLTGQPTPTRYERSDFCHVPRAVPVAEAMLAFVLADALLERLGGDTLETLQARFAALPALHRTAFRLDGQPHAWWPADSAPDLPPETSQEP